MTFLLDAPFVDVRGDTLCWTLDPVDRAPLATRRIDVDGDTQVSLHVLGASHQVIVEHRGEALLSETVACDLINAAPMPATSHAHPGYTFTSATENISPTEFTDHVDGVLRRLGTRPQTLVARFPGLPDAVTALELESDGDTLTWRTWHAYPQTGELVGTTSVFSPVKHTASLTDYPLDQHEEFADA